MRNWAVRGFAVAGNVALTVHLRTRAAIGLLICMSAAGHRDLTVRFAGKARTRVSGYGACWHPTSGALIAATD